MRALVILSGVMLLLVAGVTACNSNDRSPPVSIASQPGPQVAQAPSPGEDVRRITPAELRALMDKGQAFVIDVRNQDMYKAGHIKGSIVIPSTEILSHVDELPKDKTIVTYCS
jgi:3-mercaptopyruvate sulfurtransferase SseA